MNSCHQLHHCLNLTTAVPCDTKIVTPKLGVTNEPKTDITHDFHLVLLLISWAQFTENGEVEFTSSAGHHVFSLTTSGKILENCHGRLEQWKKV